MFREGKRILDEVSLEGRNGKCSVKRDHGGLEPSSKIIFRIMKKKTRLFLSCVYYIVGCTAAKLWDLLGLTGDGDRCVQVFLLCNVIPFLPNLTIVRIKVMVILY